MPKKGEGAYGFYQLSLIMPEIVDQLLGIACFALVKSKGKFRFHLFEHINADDLEEMVLKWQVAMLTMRVKRFIKKTGRKLDLNGKETVGFDRTKVECYNCHRTGHFAMKCRAQESGNRNRDDPRRNSPMDTSTTNALVV
ncbi:ribonuclease H-like domain-containing protein [Tanacetum coccineum]